MPRPQLLPAGLSLIVSGDSAFWSPSVPGVSTGCFPTRPPLMGMSFVSLGTLLLCPHRWWRGLSLLLLGVCSGARHLDDKSLPVPAAFWVLVGNPDTPMLEEPCTLPGVLGPRV